MRENQVKREIASGGVAFGVMAFEFNTTGLVWLAGGAGDRRDGPVRGVWGQQRLDPRPLHASAAGPALPRARGAVDADGPALPVPDAEPKSPFAQRIYNVRPFSACRP